MENMLQYTLEGEAVPVGEGDKTPQPIYTECYANDDDGIGILVGCLTISEVSQLWGKSPKTVRLRCYKADLEYRVTGKVWLITYRSAKELWGNPQRIMKNV